MTGCCAGVWGYMQPSEDHPSSFITVVLLDKALLASCCPAADDCRTGVITEAIMLMLILKNTLVCTDCFCKMSCKCSDTQCGSSLCTNCLSA